ncbi:hypothetical protein SBADM41S_01440 [Streptomyces badius]
MNCAQKTLPEFGVDVDWYTTRERTYEEVLPWDHLDSGLDKDWLWEDWQDALDETEVEDCHCDPLLRLRGLPAARPGHPDEPAEEATTAWSTSWRKVTGLGGACKRRFGNCNRLWFPA